MSTGITENKLERKKRKEGLKEINEQRRLKKTFKEGK